jgi:1,4-alpha-glucan branching enzyme
MKDSCVLSIVLNGHLPFVRSAEQRGSFEERWFYEALFNTYLPLLQVFDRLDADRIPFRLGMVLSPILCHMLQDELLLSRYLDYVDTRIDFGERELERTRGNPPLHELVRFYYDQAVDKRILFTEVYEKNILGIFNYYQQKGRLELLTTAATYAFLPFFTSSPEAIQAQIETAIASHRQNFGRNPQGFWLPELGWDERLDAILAAYNFGYTLVDAHGLVLGTPPVKKGSFYPVKTPRGVFILGRDFYAGRDLASFTAASGPAGPVYQADFQDAGFELPTELVGSFLGSGGSRTGTGYRYWSRQRNGERQLYDPQKARDRAAEHARAFLDARLSYLAEAAPYLEGKAISLCAFDADSFGRVWYEGPDFIETLFREGARRQSPQFMNPAEYLYKQDPASFQTMTPEYTSWGINGYAETLLDASNDWMYRHAFRALQRMIEMAERFPDDTGLKERALNQAAREILLVQGSDWPKLLYQQESAEYARNQIEEALRNFTTIYESLGSNYISTEWLTSLERRHNNFPVINYRVFRRKK